MSKEMKKPMVLLVEDCDDDAFFFRRALEKSGLDCCVEHITDGAKAVDFLEKAARSDGESLPRTIFLDLKMPLLDGFQVLEWLRSQSFAAEIQVIVLSGSDHATDKARAARLGAADYLVKPVKVAELQRFLSHVCPPKMGVPV